MAFNHLIKLLKEHGTAVNTPAFKGDRLLFDDDGKEITDSFDLYERVCRDSERTEQENVVCFMKLLSLIKKEVVARPAGVANSSFLRKYTETVANDIRVISVSFIVDVFYVMQYIVPFCAGKQK